MNKIRIKSQTHEKEINLDFEMQMFQLIDCFYLFSERTSLKSLQLLIRF